MASLNLPELQDLAGEGGYVPSAALSSFSAVLLLSACRAFLHNPRFWTGAAHYLTPEELDEIDELVSQAESELMGAAAPVGTRPDYVFYNKIGGGADGGTFNDGAWRDRDMTYIDINNGGLGSIDAGTFNVPTATYWVYAWAVSFRVGENNIRIVDDLTQVPAASLIPSAGMGRESEKSTHSVAELWGVQNLLIGIDYMLQHQGSFDRASDGMGRASGWLTDNYYAGIFLTQL